MSLPSLLTLVVLTILMKSASSMDLRGLRHVDDWSWRETDALPSFSKRRVSASDPWSLCPHTMERVDCFYEYLRVYARLRKATEYSNTVSVRNIGKRFAYTTIKNYQDML